MSLHLVWLFVVNTREGRFADPPCLERAWAFSVVTLFYTKLSKNLRFCTLWFSIDCINVWLETGILLYWQRAFIPVLLSSVYTDLALGYPWTESFLICMFTCRSQKYITLNFEVDEYVLPGTFALNESQIHASKKGTCFSELVTLQALSPVLVFSCQLLS